MFNRARLKLTAWYLLILMTVTVFFSITIHHMLIRQVTTFVAEQRIMIERRFGPLQASWNGEMEFIEDANHRIIGTLILINSAILLIVGGLSFFLAGKTLIPIKIMIEEQNRFISDSSHELRTPLTSLKLAMEVALRSKKFTLKEAKSLIEENISEVDRLKLLSDRLLYLASGIKANSQSQSEKISLKKVVDSSIKNVLTLAKVKKVKIKNSIKKDRQTIGSREKIEELFGIILENAIKYSESRGSITINMATRKQFAAISIKDEGIGIDKKDLPHIFDRFFRGDLARSRGNRNGFGLGLSIATKIAKDHSGSISVVSSKGGGTTFTVYLPI